MSNKPPPSSLAACSDSVSNICKEPNKEVQFQLISNIVQICKQGIEALTLMLDCSMKVQGIKK